MADTLYAHETVAVLVNRPIAAFDFDSTLREHKGKGPPAELTARFLAHLSRLYNVVVFSNRSEKNPDVEALDEYAELVEYHGGALTMYGALKHDAYRKPHTGMWRRYLQHLAKHGYKNAERGRGHFFAGDAAGREHDFAASDAQFAAHVGLRFVVPEAIFGPIVMQISRDQPHESNVDADYSPETLAALAAVPHEEKGGALASITEITRAAGIRRLFVLMCGSPASGKTTWAKKLSVLLRFALVSRDEHKGARFRAALQDQMTKKGSVIADSTGPTRAARFELGDLARAMGAKVVVVHVATPKQLCLHLNEARCELEGVPPVPAIAIHKHWKNWEPVTADEGDHIFTVPFALAPDAPREVTQFRWL